MKVLLFGATGMVGRGVLLECLRDPDVELVMTVGRAATGMRDAKVREIVHRDMLNYAGMEESLTGLDACFFCLGVSSTGMKEADYERVTYGFTMAAAEMLSRVNKGMTFIYVSGSGTDSSEQGRSMWARVKGRTENALLRLPLEAYMFRPGFIEPMDGIKSKTADVPGVLRGGRARAAAAAVDAAEPGACRRGISDGRCCALRGRDMRSGCWRRRTYGRWREPERVAERHFNVALDSDESHLEMGYRPRDG